MVFRVDGHREKEKEKNIPCHQIGTSVNHKRLLLKSVNTIDKSHKLYDSLDLIEISDLVIESRENAESHSFGSFLSFLGCQIFSYLTRDQITINCCWKMPRKKEKITRL